MLQPLQVMKDIGESWEEVKLSMLRDIEKLIPAFLDDLKGLKISGRQYIECRNDQRKLELDMDSEDITKFQRTHDKTWNDESCFLCTIKKTIFLMWQRLGNIDEIK